MAVVRSKRRIKPVDYSLEGGSSEFSDGKHFVSLPLLVTAHLQMTLLNLLLPRGPRN